MNRRLVLIAVGTLGAAAVVTQLTLLRELPLAFAGNELVLGVALGLWLLLTGVGTLLGRGSADRASVAFVAGFLAIALLPLAQLLAVRGLREVVFPYGVVPGLAGTMLGCAAVLLPFCLVSGALLTVASKLISGEHEGAAVGHVYAADAAGSIAGGVAFSFILVGRVDHVTLLCIQAVVALGMAASLAARLRWPLGIVAAALAAGAIAVMTAAWDVDAVSEQWRHRGTVVTRTTSPYGRVVVTREAGQLTFFENGVPVVTSPDPAGAEEAAHYAMAQRPDAREVLVIGGAVSGVAREVLRHPVAAVTAIELDPRFVASGRELLPGNFQDPRLRIVLDDGRRFIRRTAARFDVIILALPDPSTLQLNRFYTAEFFAMAKRALVPGGVIGFGLSRYENYVGPELARLLSSAHRTLAAEFTHVVMIPSGRVYFLGSDKPLSLDIAGHLEESGLSLQRLNRHYLQATLAPDRIADLERVIDAAADPNTDFFPRLFHHHLRHWLSQFGPATAVPVMLMILLAAVGLVGSGAAARIVFSAGFAGTALPIVILLAVQVYYGSLYRQLGLVVTLFMAGLAAGAAWMNRRAVPAFPLRSLARLGLAVALAAAVLPWLLGILPGGSVDGTGGLGGQVLLLAIAFGLAAVIGAQFPLAGHAVRGSAPEAVASRLFVADFVGAALGALMVSTWLLPRAGLTTVCILTAGLNAATAALAACRT